MSTEPINIVSYADGPEQLLSNFAHTPFELDGIRFESMEGLLQGLKVEDPEKQLRIFGKYGRQAKNAGTKARTQRIWEEGTVWWQGKPIAFPSADHLGLIERGLRPKFSQNEEARAALVATGDRRLTHDTGKPESPRTSLPAARFLSFLENIRRDLQEVDATLAGLAEDRNNEASLQWIGQAQSMITRESTSSPDRERLVSALVLKCGDPNAEIRARALWTLHWAAWRKCVDPGLVAEKLYAATLDPQQTIREHVWSLLISHEIVRAGLSPSPILDTRFRRGIGPIKGPEDFQVAIAELRELEGRERTKHDDQYMRDLQAAIHRFEEIPKT